MQQDYDKNTDAADFHSDLQFVIRRVEQRLPAKTY